MKAIFKNIKAVAVIFLTLLVTSCEVEGIEPIDTLSSDINLSRSGAPVDYWGRFIPGTATGTNVLESLAPAGNSSSKKFTIQWPHCTNPPNSNCAPVFNLTVIEASTGNAYHPNYRVQISLHKKAGKITGFQMWLHDGDYRFATEKIKLDDPIDFPLIEDEVIIEINEEVELFRYLTGGNHFRESVGDITIGSLEYCQKDEACVGWN